MFFPDGIKYRMGLNSTGLDTAKPLSVDDRVRLACSRQFFGHAAGNMASFNLGALLIGFVLYSGGVAVGILAAWYGAVVALSILITAFERRVGEAMLTLDNCVELVRTRIMVGAVIASLYGIATFMLPGDLTPQHDTFLFIIMTTIVTVAALGYSTTPRYFLILDIVCLIPMTLHFAYISATYRDTYYLALLIVSLTWQGVVIKKGLHASATAIAGIASNERLQDEIAEHTKTKAQIQHIAMHDPLTGLANRRHFEETSERMLKAAERRAIALGIVMIDLDDFKPINDNYGHAVGDAVLQAIARRLQDNLRASDFVARIGGDEFTLIIENLETPGALSEVVQKFSLSLNSPLTVGETSLNVGASLGHAAYPQDGSTLDELMRIADQRMYAQKATHKAAIAR